MRFNTMRKGFSVRDMIGTAQNAFGQTGLNIVSSGNGFLMGSGGGALVLCSAMAINDGECHVIVVGAAEDDQATQVTDRVAAILQGAAHF
jgi:hypothetical protein